MTQAFNLSQFANKLNSSGQTDNTGLQNSSVTVTAGTGLSGGGAVALGSSVTLTNAGVTSFNGSTGAVTVTVGSGSVTSVATGNGLQGGTITTSGTLSVACPTYNTVGSYIFAAVAKSSGTVTSGSNYAAGAGNLQARAAAFRDTIGGPSSGSVFQTTNNISGTWKWMGGTLADNYGEAVYGIMCRVS